MFFDADSVESEILYFDSIGICQEMAVVGDLRNIKDVITEFASDLDMVKVKDNAYLNLCSQTIWTIAEDSDDKTMYFVKVSRK